MNHEDSPMMMRDEPEGWARADMIIPSAPSSRKRGDEGKHIQLSEFYLEGADRNQRPPKDTKQLISGFLHVNDSNRAKRDTLSLFKPMK
jgi:hypothetical protein